MVVKAKSEAPIQIIKNVTKYSAWKAPSINVEGGNVFRQEVKEEIIKVEPQKEMISADALQKIKEQAQAEGFEKGKQQGLQAAQIEIDQKTKILNNMLKQLCEPLESCGQKTQQELLELAFAISRQIVRRELKQDPTQMIAIIRESLKLLPIGSKNIKILLNPEDALVVKDVLSLGDSPSDSIWKLVEEPSMERGGCLVKSDNSNIDASIDKQVAVLFSRVAGGQRAGEKKTDDNKITNKKTTDNNERLENNNNLNPKGDDHVDG